jgi:hypothetical protein
MAGWRQKTKKDQRALESSIQGTLVFYDPGGGALR